VFGISNTDTGKKVFKSYSISWP